MALINPLLATWDLDGVIRTYEYTAGVFSPVASVGGFVHLTDEAFLEAGAIEVPFMKWDHLDTQFVIFWTPSVSIPRMDKFDALCDNAGGYQISSVTAGNGYMFVKALDDDEYILRQINTSTTKRLASNAININPTEEALGGVQSGATTPPLHNFFPSPDATKILNYHLSGSRYRLYTKLPPAINFTQTLVQDSFGAFLPDQFAWASDSLNIVAINTTENRAQSWRYDPDENEWVYTHELSMLTGAGDIVNFVMSPDKRIFAISYNDSGTYTTRTYRRTGDYYTVLQDLSGIGALLSFSADGVLMIDSAEKACYTISDETFFETNYIMASLPVGIMSQAVSDARTTNRGTAQLYDDTIAEFVGDSVDRDNLKITLLTTSAAFDSSHATISDVTNAGAYEVSTGGWPSGGLLLENVVETPGDGYTRFTCDAIVHVVILSAMAARYAVIYDATSNKPLVFLDLTTNRTVSRNRQLTLDFSANEFLRFVR